MRDRLGALLLVLVALPSQAGVAPERERELKNLVLQDCGSCHGLTRKGGLGSPLTVAALQGRTSETIAATILDGLPGTAMPPWRPLITEPEARWIADYLLKGDTQ